MTIYYQLGLIMKDDMEITKKIYDSLNNYSGELIQRSITSDPHVPLKIAMVAKLFAWIFESFENADMTTILVVQSMLEQINNSARKMDLNVFIDAQRIIFSINRPNIDNISNVSNPDVVNDDISDNNDINNINNDIDYL